MILIASFAICLRSLRSLLVSNIDVHAPMYFRKSSNYKLPIANYKLLYPVYIPLEYIMRSRLFLLVPVFLLSSLCLAQIGYSGGSGYRLRMKTAGEYAALQRQLVGAYCRLDFEGSRLSDDNWSKIKPLVRFKQNADFNVVEIVSRYQIAPPEGQSSQFVTVKYVVLGRYEIGYGYTAAPTNNDVNFRIEEKDDQLEITNIEPNTPRVSKRVAVQWLKSRLEKSTNPIEKSQIEKSLAVLDPPPAAASTETTPPPK
jgi:hypothetical protein